MTQPVNRGNYTFLIPLALAASHAVLFAITVIYVSKSSDGQAALVWLFWDVPDFPISLLHWFAPQYSQWVHAIAQRDSFLDYVLYAPHLIHGLFGTIWWFVMPRFILVAITHRRLMKHETSLSVSNEEDAK